MSLILETTRLELHEFRLGDVAFIIDLLNSKGWIKYIGDRNVRTVEQAMAYLKNGPLKSYEEKGFGMYKVVLKPGYEAVGMCGFVKREYLEHPDLGFAFLPGFTGLGYAFEIALKTLEFGFKDLKQQKIYGITLPENLNSIRLLEKLGFAYEHNILSETGEELMLFGKREFMI